MRKKSFDTKAEKIESSIIGIEKNDFQTNSRLVKDQYPLKPGDL